MSCPSSCARREGRREFFRQARDDLECDDGDSELAEPEPERTEEVALELDAERIVARTQGREGWLREGRRQVEAASMGRPGSDPLARVRSGCCWRSSGWDGELDVERRANQAYEAYRARGRMKDGRRFGGPPNPYHAAGSARGKGERDRSRLAADPDASGRAGKMRRPRSTSSTSCWRRRSPPTRPTSRSLTRW